MNSVDSSDRRVWRREARGRLHITHLASPTGLLLPAPAAPLGEPHAGPQPALVMPWSPARMWHPRHGRAAGGQQGGPGGADGEGTLGPGPAPGSDPHPAPGPDLGPGPGPDPGCGPGLPPQPPADFLVGGWLAGFIDPRTWGLGRPPSCDYVVREGCSRQLQLQRSQQPADSHPHSPMRPAIWADAPDDPRSGLRVLKARWLEGEAGGAQGAAPSTCSGRRGAPDSSTNAAWMHPAPPRPPSERVRLQSGSAAAAQQPQQQRPPPEPDDLQDRAARQPGAPVPWGQVWQAVSDRSLDRDQCILAWRILHGKLRIGAFLRRMGTGTRAQHVCPHACCSAVPATLTHMFVRTCPVAAAVVAWVSATWGALTGAAGPPHSADLFLANDRRAWAPSGPLHLFSLLKGKVSSEHQVGQVARFLATLMSGYDKPMGIFWAPRHTPHCGRLAVMHLDTLSVKTPYNDSPSGPLQGLWQRLRLAMLASLLAAHRAAQAQPAAQQSAGAVSARILARMRAALRRDWLLVGGGLRRAGGLCSAWYRGRDPQLSRAAFVERWCHSGVLCTLPAGGGGGAPHTLDHRRSTSCQGMGGPALLCFLHHRSCFTLTLQ